MWRSKSILSCDCIFALIFPSWLPWQSTNLEKQMIKIYQSQPTDLTFWACVEMNFWSHIDAICDLSLNRCTATWNSSVSVPSAWWTVMNLCFKQTSMLFCLQFSNNKGSELEKNCKRIKIYILFSCHRTSCHCLLLDCNCIHVKCNLLWPLLVVGKQTFLDV